MIKFLKKVYTDEYDIPDEAENIAYDLAVSEAAEDGDESADEALDEIAKAVGRKLSFAGKQAALSEEERYDQMLNSVQAKGLLQAVDGVEHRPEPDLKPDAEEFSRQAVKLPDVSRKPRKLDRVNIDLYDKEETRGYVRSQCEVMAEASGHIDLAMAEYRDVAEHFSDVELLDNAPEEIRKGIQEAAQRVDNLTVDRRIFQAAESKLSANAYHRMEQFEEEIPKGLKYMQKQETYYETVKRDMQMLEGERLGLRLEARRLDRRQLQIKSAALAAVVCLAVVFSIFVIAIVATQEEEENLYLFLVVTVLGATLAMGMFALLKMTQRQVLVTEIRLNKATNLLNKTKIKYINAANTLDYEYQKFHVKSSYEFAKKYQYYLEMKEERRNLRRMTEHLNDAEEELLRMLENLGMADPDIWLGQVRGLYDPKEMVEVRHDLALQRQKLRGQIDYNERRIEEAKQNIKRVTVLHSDFLPEALRIIEQYERVQR